MRRKSELQQYRLDDVLEQAAAWYDGETFRLATFCILSVDGFDETPYRDGLAYK